MSTLMNVTTATAAAAGERQDIEKTSNKKVFGSILFHFFGCLLYYWDVSSDIYLAYQFYISSDWIHFGFTFVIILLQFVTRVIYNEIVSHPVCRKRFNTYILALFQLELFYK